MGGEGDGRLPDFFRVIRRAEYSNNRNSLSAPSGDTVESRRAFAQEGDAARIDRAAIPIERYGLALLEAHSAAATSPSSAAARSGRVIAVTSSKMARNSLAP